MAGASTIDHQSDPNVLSSFSWTGVVEKPIESRKDRTMHGARVLGLLTLALAGLAPGMIEAACCYFSAKDADILQPGQQYA